MYSTKIQLFLNVGDFKKFLIQRHQGLINYQILDPVPVQVVRYDGSELEIFGKSVFGNRPHEAKSLKFYDYRQLFELGEEAGKEFLEENSKYIRIDESSISKYKNIIGVVGAAGIGKTTLAKSMLNYTLDFMIEDQAYVFYLPLRSIDFDKKMSVLEFLVKYTLPTWEHDLKSDRKLLAHIMQTQRTFIITDGLDEVDAELLKSRAPDISLYDYTYPDKILKNLLSGHLLPNAKKVISSRPGAFHQLHPVYRPHFVVQVTGLNYSSQNLLIEQLCSNNADRARVKKQLESQQNIAMFCVNPMHCIMVVKHLLHKQHQKIEVVSLSQVFVSTFVSCIRSDHFKGNLENIVQLTLLAFDGLEKNQFVFTWADLRGGKNVTEVFLRLGVISKTQFHMKILDGDKRFFFAHLQWQEFFAALHLMFVVSVDEFSEAASHFHQPRWTIVVKFMFGFFAPGIGDMAAIVFPNQPKHDFEHKKQILENIIPTSVSFGTLRKQTDFFKVCGWAFEANSHSITQRFIVSLPQRIQLTHHLDPSDLASLCYVLRQADKPYSITVDYGIFLGNSLAQLVNATDNTIHKVRNGLYYELTTSVRIFVCVCMVINDELD